VARASAASVARASAGARNSAASVRARDSAARARASVARARANVASARARTSLTQYVMQEIPEYTEVEFLSYSRHIVVIVRIHRLSW
jgi:hypothetical protein